MVEYSKIWRNAFDIFTLIAKFVFANMSMRQNINCERRICSKSHHINRHREILGPVTERYSDPSQRDTRFRHREILGPVTDRYSDPYSITI